MSSDSQEPHNRTRRSPHQTKACIRCKKQKHKCIYRTSGPCTECQRRRIECLFLPDKRSKEARRLGGSGALPEASGHGLSTSISQPDGDGINMSSPTTPSGSSVLALLDIATAQLYALHLYRMDGAGLLHPSNDDRAFDENIMGAAQRVSTALLCVIGRVPLLQTTNEDSIQGHPASSSGTTSSSSEPIGYAQSDAIDMQTWTPPAPAVLESFPETNLIPRTPAAHSFVETHRSGGVPAQPFTLCASDRDYV